ncbi:uncharacterized protein SCDLUD_003068 [Saccharomycodes ludwigii]|uniref:uncharacterized protein n=1 Tax=Saccharomycodes ludwigii TaxID=36035 RepID=UPI001E89DC45|nr:hypothetical protein SCDLUD_003068 [Saccharomycodes ludwigii]KAH3900101.1 hypothetical protein SCDLUD_003068 [Saccharomycodes ludwigii]
METSVINERLLLDFLLSDDENNNQEPEPSYSYDLSLKASSLIVTEVTSTQKSQSCSETEEPNVVTFIPDHEDNLHDKSNTIEEEDFLDGLEDMIGGSFTLTNKPNKVNDNPKKKNKKINNGSKTDDTDSGTITENDHITVKVEPFDSDESIKNNNEKKKKKEEKKKKKRKEERKKRKEERKKEEEEEKEKKKKEEKEEKERRKKEKEKKEKKEKEKEEREKEKEKRKKKKKKEKHTKNKPQKENKDTSTKDIETEVSTDVITISAQNLGAIEDTICDLDEKVGNFNNGKEINANIPDGKNADGKGSCSPRQGKSDKDHYNVLNETIRQRKRREKKTKNKVSTKSTIEKGLQAPDGIREKDKDNAENKTFKFKKYQSKPSKTADKVTRLSEDYNSDVDNKEEVSERPNNKRFKKNKNLKSKRNKRLLRKDKEINDGDINHKILKSIIEKEGNQSTTEQNIILDKELKKVNLSENDSDKSKPDKNKTVKNKTVKNKTIKNRTTKKKGLSKISKIGREKEHSIV